MSINITASFRHCSQKSDWHGREYSEALFDASVHIGQIDEILDYEIFFLLDRSSDFFDEFVQDIWVPK